MKDNKFRVMCALGAMWFVLFIGMAMGDLRVNRNVEWLVSFLCLAWFAYWTISVIRDYLKKDKDVPMVPVDNVTTVKPSDQPVPKCCTETTEKVETNAKPENN